MACGKMKPLHICCGTTFLLILVLFTTLLILSLTILKPKPPKIRTQQVTLDHLEFSLISLELNLTFGILVNVYNPNYGSFKYDNATVYVKYHGLNASEGAIKADTVPARGSYDVGTEIGFSTGELLTNPYVFGDFATGCFNFTSSTTLKGKAKILKLLTLKATVHSTCDISVFVVTKNSTSVCTSKVEY